MAAGDPEEKSLSNQFGRATARRLAGTPPRHGRYPDLNKYPYRAMNHSACWCD
jgi:hypothetical protein